MLKGCWAMAVLTLRNAFRSRVALCLLGLLAVVVLLLPASIRGDGSAEGGARVLLLYTIGLGVAILGAATLWVSASAVSCDVASGRIQLTLVKPISRLAIWLGTWLGVVLLNVLLLSVVLGAVWAQLALRAQRHGGEGDSRGPAARETLQPEVDARAAARAWYDRLAAHGQLPEGHQREAFLATLRERMDGLYVSIDPGAARTWRFDLRGVEAAGRMPPLLQFHFVTPDQGRQEVRGTLTVAARRAVDGLDGTAPYLWRGRLEGTANRALSWSLPAALPADARVLAVTFEQDAAGERALTIQQTRGVLLRVVRGSFAGNLLRAGLMLLAGLASVAALGVTLGCMASLPVAVFLAAALLTIVGISQLQWVGESWGGGHDHGGAGQEGTPAWVTHASEVFLRGIGRALAPLLRGRPLGALAAGDRLAADRTAAAVLLGMLGYPLLLALPGWGALRWREFGGVCE